MSRGKSTFAIVGALGFIVSSTMTVAVLAGGDTPTTPSIVITNGPTPNPAAPNATIITNVTISCTTATGQTESPPPDMTFNWHLSGGRYWELSQGTAAGPSPTYTSPIDQTVHWAAGAAPPFGSTTTLAPPTTANSELTAVLTTAGYWEIDFYCNVEDDDYGGSDSPTASVTITTQGQTVGDVTATDADHSNRMVHKGGTLQMVWSPAVPTRSATLAAVPAIQGPFAPGDPAWSESSTPCLPSNCNGQNPITWSATGSSSTPSVNDSVTATAGSVSLSDNVQLVPNAPGSITVDTIVTELDATCLSTINAWISYVGGPDLELSCTGSIVASYETVDGYAVPTVATKWTASGSARLQAQMNQEFPIPGLALPAGLGSVYLVLGAGGELDCNAINFTYDPSQAPGSQYSADSGTVTGTVSVKATIEGKVNVGWIQISAQGGLQASCSATGGPPTISSNGQSINIPVAFTFGALAAQGEVDFASTSDPDTPLTYQVSQTFCNGYTTNTAFTIAVP